MDLLALPGRLDVIEALVAVDRPMQLASLGCADVLCWLPEAPSLPGGAPPRRATSTRAPSRSSPIARAAPSAEDLEFLAAPRARRVHFTLGDTDLV